MKHCAFREAHPKKWKPIVVLSVSFFLFFVLFGFLNRFMAFFLFLFPKKVHPNLLTRDLASNISTWETQPWKRFVIWKDGWRDKPIWKTDIWKKKLICCDKCHACNVSLVTMRGYESDLPRGILYFIFLESALINWWFRTSLHTKASRNRLFQTQKTQHDPTQPGDWALTKLAALETHVGPSHETC